MAMTLLASLPSFGATHAIDGGRYTITVPEGEEYRMSSADLAALGSLDLVKDGPGTLVAGAEMKDFSGDIHITNGIYRAEAEGALGPAGGTVRIYPDGTLHNKIWAPSDWADGGGLPALGQKEHLIFEGDGFQGMGAITNSEICENFVLSAEMVGDALITASRPLTIRYASKFDMHGHKLAFRSDNGMRFGFVDSWGCPQNAGDIEINGGLWYAANTATGEAGNTVTMHSGSELYLWQSWAWLAPGLRLEDGSSISSGGDSLPQEIGLMRPPNYWGGPVELSGFVTNRLERNNRFSIAGVVSGEGGFAGGAGGCGWLQLSNANNSFTGGVGVGGIVAEDGSLVGGLNLICNGAAPANGGPITLADAQLRLYEPEISPPPTACFDLPDLVANGRGLVTNMTAKPADVRIKSITKTGAGDLTISIPCEIQGKTDVTGGTLRFGGRVPEAISGLNMQVVYKDVGSESMIDSTGVGYAYKPWPEPWAMFSGSGCQEVWYTYTGSICVPGEPGTVVNCNFASSIYREAIITIDGVELLNAHIDRQSFGESGVVSLTAGWHSIVINMHNWWWEPWGPNPNTDIGWTANFGIGVDWQGRCTKDYRDYEKLIDPGDGSFLRACERSEIDPVVYRPVFRDAVAFASGAVFDANDVAPYFPVEFPSLTGLPTITNGAVRVVSPEWTVRASDAIGGQPLTVAAGCELSFAENTQLVLEGDWQEVRRQAGRRIRLISLGDDARLVNAPTFHPDRDCKWRAEWSDDGRTLDLVYSPGFMVIIR